MRRSERGESVTVAIVASRGPFRRAWVVRLLPGITVESMSTDFIALFDVASDDITPKWLLARLSAPHTSFAAELIERYRDHWQTQAWTIETSPATGEPTI